MTLRIPAKVCSYDFYDMTLSTGKQRRHMIIVYTNFPHVSNLLQRLIYVRWYVFETEKIVLFLW